MYFKYLSPPLECTLRAEALADPHHCYIPVVQCLAYRLREGLGEGSEPRIQAPKAACLM